MTSWEGEVCRACERSYFDVYQLPDEVWNLITPDSERPKAGLLCPTCALERVSEQLQQALRVVNDLEYVRECRDLWRRQAKSLHERSRGCTCKLEPWEEGSFDEYLACPYHNPAGEVTR